MLNLLRSDSNLVEPISASDADDEKWAQSSNNFKYVQIKSQQFEMNGQHQLLLQIIDISSDIMYDAAQGEKKLLALINATVSHEMRNPANSIRCQN